jgi:uncharacterized membrane-anchored protein
MRKISNCLLILFAVLAFIFPVYINAQESQQKNISIDWINGPAKANLGSLAEINVPVSYHFASGDDTRKLMELFGNQPTDREVGYIAPKTDEWFMIFEFDETGYIKDDEKNSLDADKILQRFKDGDKEANKWRREQNLPELDVIGWHKKPAYDPVTNNLEWATIYQSEGQKGINYNIRYLGRKGVMEVVIVADEKNLVKTVASAKKILSSYTFSAGNKYSEFRDGDKIAEYGLAALVGGGALAVAAKSGLLQKFWKLIVVAVIGAGAFVKKIFKGNKTDTVASNDNNE